LDLAPYIFTPMATYVYETIPQHPNELPVRIEVVQSMKDRPLKRHPETGEPVRRVISGGFGLMGVGDKGANLPQATRHRTRGVDDARPAMVPRRHAPPPVPPLILPEAAPE
jgi:predicted nucleic acid-binding Zn ribbon protein